MIPTGLLATVPDPVPAQLVDHMTAVVRSATAATRATNTLRRNVRTFTVIAELTTLSPDQVWGRMYVRGGMDHRYVEPDAVDEYLRVLNGIPGEKGEAARAGFLRGWAEHRSVPTAPVVWHRFMGDTAIQVNPEAQR